LDQRNLIVAVIVSAIILIGYQVFYEMPRMRAHQAQQQALVVEQQAQQGTAAGTAADAAAEPPVMAPGSENAAPTVASATDKPRHNGLSDFGNALDGSPSRFSGPSAMIRDDDSIGAVLDSQRRIFSRLEAFDDDLHFGHVFQPLNEVPGE